MCGISSYLIAFLCYDWKPKILEHTKYLPLVTVANVPGISDPRSLFTALVLIKPPAYRIPRTEETRLRIRLGKVRYLPLLYSITFL